MTTKPHKSRHYYLTSLCLGIGLLLCCILTTARADTLDAQVDKSNLSELDFITLTVSYSGSSAQTPDFSVLEKDFNVINTSQASQFSTVNGRSNSKIIWTILLSPRKTGTLIIPPLTVNQSTSQPITLTVNAGTLTKKTAVEDAFIEVSLEPKEVYVQGQSILTIKLHTKNEIIDGELSTPETENIVVEQLVQSDKKLTTIKGQRYYVYERQYALFPETSGTISIPEIFFVGKVESPRRQSFSNRLFFSRDYELVRTKSSPTTLTVLPKPNNYPATSPWLPANSIELSSQWVNQPSDIQVGESLTRMVKIEAEGLLDSQLPEFKMEQTASGFSIYPDKPIRRTFIQNGRLHSELIQHWAVVPTIEGTLVMPELKLDWWNTQTNRLEQAVSVSTKIAVSAKPTQMPLGNEHGEFENLANNAPKSRVNTQSFWFYLTWLFSGLWLITLLLWFITARNRHTDPTLQSLRFAHATSSNEKHAIHPATTRQSLPHNSELNLYNHRTLLKTLKKACHANDSLAAQKALIQWGKAVLGLPMLQSLRQIVDCVEHTKLQQAVRELEHCLYAKEKHAWHGERLWLAVKNFKPNKIKSTKEMHAIPDLYPKKQTAG